MRGSQGGLGGRIIPARAGFTPGAPNRGLPGPDHPRSRGVYCAASAETRCSAGSSPLARGLRRRRAQRRSRCGIIPARAGFTSYASPPICVPQDHPRSRGVYSSRRMSGAPRAGSSPLARGLLLFSVGRLDCVRIIPARAGFTALPCPPTRRSTDHPRSRGVYLTALATMRITSGSSPLARGLPPRIQPSRSLCGIIPARAGFTTPSRAGETSARDHPRSRGVYGLPSAGYDPE